MRTFARLVLIWLLAVALPLQGAAAATMLVCWAGSQPSALLEAAPHVHGENVASTSDRHDGHGVVPAHAVVASADPDDAPLQGSHQHKCSACASCCLGAFVSSPEAGLPESVQLANFYLPLTTGALPAFLTPGIERPPRSFLA